MKTDIYRFEKGNADITGVSELASKVADYNGLDKKQKLRLQLLCEELLSMLPNLLVYGEGEFWIENEGRSFELHAVVKAERSISMFDRDNILAVSTTGKNSAAVGIMNKIKIAAEIMMSAYIETGGTVYPDSSFSFYDQGIYSGTGTWSLSTYKAGVSEGSEAWDELEKSIIAKLADDVTVGIISGRIEITVRKTF